MPPGFASEAPNRCHGAWGPNAQTTGKGATDLRTPRWQPAPRPHCQSQTLQCNHLAGAEKGQISVPEWISKLPHLILADLSLTQHREGPSDGQGPCGGAGGAEGSRGPVPQGWSMRTRPSGGPGAQPPPQGRGNAPGGL